MLLAAFITQGHSKIDESYVGLVTLKFVLKVSNRVTSTIVIYYLSKNPLTKGETLVISDDSYE